MAVGHRIVLASLLLNVTLVVIVASYVYPNTLQASADFLFGRFQPNPELRLWMLYGLLGGTAFFLFVVSTSSIGRAAVADHDSG